MPVSDFRSGGGCCRLIFGLSVSSALSDDRSAEAKSALPALKELVNHSNRHVGAAAVEAIKKIEKKK